MKLKVMAATAAVAMALGACQSIPKEQTLAQYCGDVKHADKDVCKVNVEIDGQKTALASTNMSLSQARATYAGPRVPRTGARHVRRRAAQGLDDRRDRLVAW